MPVLRRPVEPAGVEATFHHPRARGRTVRPPYHLANVISWHVYDMLGDLENVC